MKTRAEKQIGKEVFMKNISLALLVTALSGCYGVRPSHGGGETSSTTRKANPSDIAVPKGYRIEAVATGLTFPTGLTFDEDGEVYVVESGYSYGETWTTPRLLRIEPGNKVTVIASGGKNGPWNGVAFYDGAFFISEGGEMEGGKILRVTKDGKISSLIEGLPGKGDHHTNGPVIHNGYLYFGQGTATNSGVVGEDNAKFGWLTRNPNFHDIPCKDITLTGKNYESKNVLTDDPDDKAVTGAFVAFGTRTSAGQIIKGKVPCSGSIMRVSLDGGDPELVAWGFRNPYGLAVHDGKLFVVENGYDVRGSRPVWGTGDVLWEVETGQWYGWPDFSGDQSINQEPFNVPGKGVPELLLGERPGNPPQPLAVLAVHSSSNGMAFSTSDEFGFKGSAFIAQLGDMSPNVGKVLNPVGFKVVMVNINDGVIKDFAVNKGKVNGPASALEKGGFERPVDAKFSRDGKSLYVADFGIIKIDGEKTISEKGTGVVWRITKE